MSGAPVFLACDLLAVRTWNLACSTQQGAEENENPSPVPSRGTTVALSWGGRGNLVFLATPACREAWCTDLGHGEQGGGPWL